MLARWSCICFFLNARQYTLSLCLRLYTAEKNKNRCVSLLRRQVSYMSLAIAFDKIRKNHGGGARALFSPTTAHNPPHRRSTLHCARCLRCDLTLRVSRLHHSSIRLSPALRFDAASLIRLGERERPPSTDRDAPALTPPRRCMNRDCAPAAPPPKSCPRGPAALPPTPRAAKGRTACSARRAACSTTSARAPAR